MVHSKWEKSCSWAFNVAFSSCSNLSCKLSHLTSQDVIYFWLIYAFKICWKGNICIPVLTTMFATNIAIRYLSMYTRPNAREHSYIQ